MNVDDLEENKKDIALSLTKGGLGAIPVVGGIIGEVLSLTIPQQRIDRVIEFVKELEKRISRIELERLQENKYFLDLFEDAVLQATRCLSPARNMYIALFLYNTKDVNEHDHSIKKKLFQALESLTDDDIRILASIDRFGYMRTFQDNCPPICSISQVDKMSKEERFLYELATEELDAHIHSLVSYKLIYAIHKIQPSDPSVNQEYLDEKTGIAEIEDYQTSGLGKLLLKTINEEGA